MKNKLAIAVIFLITYIGFLIATLPTTLVLNQVSLPKNMQVSGVTGSIWSTEIAQVNIDGTSVAKVNAKLSFWSLFTLAPKLSITFGDSFIAGPEGKLELVLSAEKVEINELTLLVKANEIAQQFTLPLPLSAQGDVELTLLNATIDLANNNQCITANGSISWAKAGVVALEKNIKLGNLSADITCEKGALAVIISPKNDLGLTFSTYVRNGGKISGNGYLKPGAKFPPALNDALPFLGKKDRQGRYRLSF
ncbi:MAG: type II secretion system protein N [Colwellia sp.]|nr:type II secretion system protein N [Colwellia sp.]